MEAYLVMEQGTRKAMEGLLRTWKQPVPESMDTRPVFPADVTGDIETALGKMRAAQQAQRPQHALPPRPPTSSVAWKNTPTPPPNVPRFPAPNDPRARPASRSAAPSTPQYNVPSIPPANQYNLPIVPPSSQYSTPPVPPTPQYGAPPVQSLPLFNMGAFQPENYRAPTPLAPAAPLYSTSTPQPAATPAPAVNLAELLKLMSSNAQPQSTPVPAPFFPPPASTPLAVPPPFFPPPFSTPVQATAPAPPVAPPPVSNAPATDLATLLAQLSKGIPPQAPAPLVQAPAGDRIELTTASLKIPRFHLIDRLYDAKPNICATCGRRFANTQEGKDKKARHMDWHFKVKDPDAAKRGIHRSWYIPEKEWIEYREIDETAPPSAANGSSSHGSGGSKPKKPAKERYVSAPQDAALQQAPCPICQERFETVWNIEANDFVWMDALNVGGKIYHATCFEEYSRGMGIEMPGTPDSVLGKRKADIGGSGEGKKVRAY